MTARMAMLAGAGLLALAGVASADWVPAWGSAQMRSEGKDADSIAAAGAGTVRQVVHLSAGGARVRVRLSNAFGDGPMVIGAATIGRGTPGGAGSAGAVPLSFAGVRTVTIPAGAELYSDPVTMAVAAGGDVAVSLFLPSAPKRFTGHPGARATTYLASGDVTASADLAGARKIGGWWSLADVEVDGGRATGTVVAIGDSITDGHGVSDDSNARWTDVLATRLRANAATAGLSVVNAGIGGNRVLLDGLGPNLLARFDRDVIARPGVRAAIVLEGVNDLGVLTRDAPVGADAHAGIVAAVTSAYRQMAARAHEHGIRLIGATITPYVGSDYYHPAPVSEADRQAINAFIRTSGTFDGVVDFDRTVRDPGHPDRLLPAYDSGDHLHPGEAGYKAMGEAVPLALFAGTARPARAVVGAAAAVPVSLQAGAASTPPSGKPVIALTFDDMPAHGPLPQGGDRLAIAKAIIAALQAHHAPAFGFFNGGFASDASAAEVLGAWRQAGYPIGNHTWSHGNLDAATPAAYLADAERNEPILAAAGRGTDWHWFRYPFLSEGSDAAKRDAVRSGLRAKGYKVAAVTMSFGDYAWNDAYARCVAKHDGGAIAGLETSYLAAARAQATRSRTLAKGALGRDIPYVLLMHLGAFDARVLPRLLDLYEGMGFGFTTLPAAEADPFYASAVDLSVPANSPTLEGAAGTKGMKVPANYPLPGANICA